MPQNRITNTIRFSIRLGKRVTSISLRKNNIALWILLKNEDLTDLSKEDISNTVLNFIYVCLNDWNNDNGKGLSEYVSERMIQGSLGGQYFLHTLILSTLSYQNLDIIESGIGIILCIVLIWAYLNKKNISKFYILLILLFFLLIKTPKVNLSFTIIPIALFISLFIVLDEGIKNKKIIFMIRHEYCQINDVTRKTSII